jgi:hypothetical protein
MTDSEMAQANLQSELDRSSKWHNGYAPWWNTMKEDPWWMTTGKAILGEKEFSELAGSHVWRKAGADPLAMLDPALAREPSDPLQFKRDILPLIDTFAPLLFMGKGSTPGGARGAVPRQTGSILKGGIEKVTEFGWPFWWGDPVSFKKPRLELPPKTGGVYSGGDAPYQDSYKPSPGDSGWAQDQSAGWWKNVPEPPAPQQKPEDKWPDLFTRGLLPGQNKGATGPLDIEGMEFKEPPYPRGIADANPGWQQKFLKESDAIQQQINNIKEQLGMPVEPTPHTVQEYVSDPAHGWDWYSPKKPPELGPTSSAMDDPIVQEYLTHLGVDPNDIQVPPPYVGPGTKLPEDIIKEQLQGIHDDISQIYQGKPTPPTWESLSPSQKQWYQDQWNKGILPPKETLPPAPEPYSVQDVANIHELGLKTPERNAGEIQQDWLNFINNIISGDSHQLPGGLEGLGNPKKMRPMYDYNIDPNTYPPPRIAPTPPPEDFDFSQYGYDLPPAPFLVA